MRLVAALLILATISLCPACSAIGINDDSEFEKVTKVWIEPSDPAPGDIVDVRVEWDSNLVYLAMVGAGPKVRFRVNAGSLIVNHDPMMGDTRISDQEALMESKTVKWQLPTDVRKATVWATMRTGGKSLTVDLE